MHQWRAIELRSQQLQNQCRQVELDEELDREERDLLREHEQLLRMKEKQLVQQQYEDRFKLRVAEAAARKLQQQSGQMREVAVAEASATVPIATTTTKTTAEVKRKSKEKAAADADGGEPPKSKKTAAVSKTNGDVVKRKKDVTKSMAFSPRKQSTAAIFQAAPAARRRSLEEAFNEEKEPDAMNKGVPKKSAADELMRMLSQDKGSDSEEDETSIGNLLLSFSPAKTSAERRYGSPSKAKTKETTNDTPSKFTPSKLARSVVKKAMAAPLDFDFTRRAELAKAKAAKEKQQAEQNDNDDDSDEEEAASTETPSKKALKRRKDLGISLSAKPAAPSKATQAKSTSAGSDATKTATAARGGKSLMEMVSAASLIEAKLSKPKEMSTQPKRSVAATSSEQGKSPLLEQSQVKEPAKPKQKDRPTKDKKGDSAEPEAEDFIGIQTANITKRAKPKQFVKSAKASSAPSESAAEPEAEDAATQKKTDKPKKKDKLSATEQAIAKADMLTRMTKMQDIATPKVPGKKMKKVLKKTTMTALAAKRAEFQKILADGTTSDAAGSRDTDGDNIDEDAGAFETPRKARTMKRKRAQDLPGQADVGGPAKKTAVTLAPQTQTGYLQSPSVAALLAMRPSKSPIGIRYVPKTPKTPQSVRTHQRPTDGDNNVQNPVGTGDAPTTFATQGASAGQLTRSKKNSVKAARNAFAGTTGALTSVAGGLWGNSGPSFFDAFVNGGAPRLKRSALP